MRHPRDNVTLAWESSILQRMVPMSRIGRWAAAVALGLAVAGCVSGGAFPAASLTSVELAESNYTVITTDATGSASAAYILGVSGFGPGVSAVAVARVSGEGQLHGEALRDLWERFATEHGAVAGRSLGLVNVRFDVDALNLILYTRVTVWVRADVVEFGT
jgi:hypothetical protein